MQCSRGPEAIKKVFRDCANDTDIVEISPEMMEDFEQFKTEIPGLIGELERLLYDSDGYRHVKADYELESVDQVELFYLDVLTGREEMISGELLDKMIIAYYGEAVIHHVGGHWELCEIEDDDAFGTPVIQGSGIDPDFRVSPVEVRERLRKNRQEGKMRDTLECCIGKNKFETEFMPEFIRGYVKKKVARRKALGSLAYLTLACIGSYLIGALICIWGRHVFRIKDPMPLLVPPSLTGCVFLLILGWVWYKYLKTMRSKESGKSPVIDYLLHNTGVDMASNIFKKLNFNKETQKEQPLKMYLLRYRGDTVSTECSISNDDPWFNEGFDDGERIENLHDLPIRYEADRYSIKTDYPYCAKWFLISKRFAAVLKTLTVDYQELPSVIYRKDRIISENFVSFVFNASYPSMHMRKSVYREIKYGIVIGLDKIVLDKKKLAEVPKHIKVFRLQEASREIIVFEEGKKAIEEAQITGLEFEELKVM